MATTKTDSRTPYIIITIIAILLIIIWIVIVVVMFFGNSGLFAENYTRPPPTDSGLVPVNGQPVTLTASEKAALKIKVDEALANIAARNA
jgi:predicted secreted protein